MKNTSIQKYEISDTPQKMQAMGKVLKDYVVINKLFSNIKGKNYAHVEGWQFGGGLLGLRPIAHDPINLSSSSEIKWMVKVDIVEAKTEKVVGRGFAICSSKENSKKGFDEYAILSMAQTRAIGKAYRNLIGWVMKLAGYEGTPSEEMHKIGEQVQAPVKAVEDESQEIVDYVCIKCGEDITKAEGDYSKKLYGKMLCRKDQKGTTRK